MICIGYAGCEAFDVILYTARTIAKLKYRVLIVDLSDSGALKQAIKHGMGLDSQKNIICYRDINYTRKIPSEYEFEMFLEGVILVVYGRNYTQDFPFPCHVINIVVNTFPHKIEGVNRLVEKMIKHEERFRLLIRNIITPDDVDRVTDSMMLPSKLEKISYLYFDLRDYEGAIHCQLKKVIRFRKVSAGMVRYIAGEIHAIFPMIKPAKIKRAIAMAGRGV
jgi:hypothetical protein